MRDGRPSRTAQHNALFRALEQRQPSPLFADPFARRFLRGRYRLYGALPARPVARFIDRRWPGPRAAVCVRTRYIDDRVAEALAAGLDQLVILGAGFDARAHRLEGLARVRVFEVDHPSTQAMKRAVVGPPPAHVRYVPADLAREPLAGRARRPRASRAGARTLFLWEGVTNYLDAASVDATLRAIARLGTSVVFTYVERALLDAIGRVRGRRRVARVRARPGRAVHVRARPGGGARVPARSAGSTSWRTSTSRPSPRATTRARGRRCRPSTAW